MNTMIYNLLNTPQNSKPLDKNNLRILYQYYEYRTILLNRPINITKEKFEIIITTIYDILKFKINEEEFQIVIENYLSLLIADAIDGYTIDHNYFIKYLWYLCAGSSNENITNKYKNCILFIQQKLIKEFNIKETTKEKIKRRIYMKYLI